MFKSGETGIRTPGTSQYNGFQDRRNRPYIGDVVEDGAKDKERAVT